MQPSSNPEYYADMHRYPRNEDDENSVDFQGYVNDDISIDRSRVLFSPITGVRVPDRGELNHPYLYILPTVQSLRPITGHRASLSPVTNPYIPVQLVPEIFPLLNQEPQARSTQPTALASGLFMRPLSGNFIDPILSPLSSDDQAFENLIIPEYQNPDASAHMPVSPATAPPSTSSTLPYPPARVITPNTETTDPATPGTTSSDAITDASLPIVRLPLGVWKCVICGAKLRRKHRAVVHFWNKHGSMRLHCLGRCGMLDCKKSFASQDGLDVHLNPVLVECSSCGKSLLKKNIIRHRDLHCPIGEVVS